MKLALTPELQEYLGIVSLQLKSQLKNVPVAENESNTNVDVASHCNDSQVTKKSIEADAHNDKNASPAETVGMPKPQIEKNEFRLLVKILQAIGHECVFNQIQYRGDLVIYHLPKKDLIFDNIAVPDDGKNMHLSSLQDMNNDASLKRAVWEKLKTLS